MRLLKINGIDVDIDEQTSIGITIQGYDIKEPNIRKTSTSNAFSIPLTPLNLRVFGFANSAFSNSLNCYTQQTADYWIDNLQMIKKGAVRIESINSRINLIVTQRPSLFDSLKDFKWVDFQKEYINFLIKNNYIKDASTGYNSFDEAVIPFLDNYRLRILACYSNEYNSIEDNYTTFYLKQAEGNHKVGAHYFVSAKAVFEFIEYYFNVNLNIDNYVNSIWVDDIFLRTYTSFRNIELCLGTTFYYQFNSDLDFSPIKVSDKEDKTLYDYVINIIKIFNLVVEQTESDNYTFIRFDEIDSTNSKDWSDKFVSVDSIKFTFDKLSQNNYVKYDNVKDGYSEYLGSGVILCKNENIDKNSNLVNIDAYIGEVRTGDFLPILNTDTSFANFDYLLTLSTKSQKTLIYDTNLQTIQTTQLLTNTSYYSLTNEYNRIRELLQYPKVLNVNLWLSFVDIINFKQSKLIYIRQLGGCFFVNKINGFNPDKSTVPTKVELIKWSNDIPTSSKEIDYLVDGINDIFVDGVTDKLY